MQKRKKLAVIGTLLIVLVAGGIVWQVVDVNRTGRSPVSALFKNEGQEASSNEPSADPVTIVLREEVPTPTPSPTPSPTPTSAPTPTSTPTSAPAESTKTGSTSGFSTESRPSGSQAGNQNTAEEPKTTPKPTPKVTPTPRPQVIEATPEPTPVPEVQNISLDTYSIDILPGDSWRINIAAAPSDFYSMGAQWVCSNSAVVSLSGSDTSGVTITAVSTGSATVTVYSRSTGQSASCTVNVN